MSPPTPPKPSAAFRVAVIGHRRDKLSMEADRDIIAAIGAVLDVTAGAVTSHLERSTDLYRSAPPRLTLYSALAEGADRLAVDALAGRGGWTLHAVLPFGITEYERDFLPPIAREPSSLERFHTQLGLATATTILDGRPGRFDAYVPLATTMVEMADLLVAVWDGADPSGPGGTANMVREARRRDVPVVRIAAEPEVAVWLEDLADADQGRRLGLGRLAGRLDLLLRPPVDPAPARRWFAERVPSSGPSRLYDRAVAFLGGFGSGFGRRLVPPRPDPIPANPGDSRRRSWCAAWPELPDATVDRVASHFAEQAGWADELARWYAARFRSTFTAIYLLAAASVLAGGLLHLELPPQWEVAGTLLECLEPALLAVMLLMVRRGRRASLHERWLDYRSLAERTRHLGTLWPLARTVPLVRIPQQPVPTDPRFGWVGWLLRAKAREAGLVPGELNGSYPEAARTLVRRIEAEDQRKFHRRRRERLGHLSEPLEHFAEALIVVALVLALLRVADLAGWLGELSAGRAEPTTVPNWPQWGIALAAVGTALPALAAGIHGFLGTADFEGSALRSAEIEGRLAQLAGQLDRLDPVDLGGVGEIAAEMTRSMEGELGSWHAAAATRRLQAG